MMVSDVGRIASFLFQRSVSALRDPGDFGSEASEVFGLFFEEAFGDEHGEVDVFVSCCLDFLVEDFLDFLPHGDGVFANNHAAFDGRVIC